MRHANLRGLALLLAAAMVAGCATSVPYKGQGPHPQLERGAPIPPVDAIGNILAVFSKILLWDWRVSNHVISEETEAHLVDYLGARDLEALGDTRFRLNQYHPFQDLKRLAKNGHVAWPYRLLIGLPVTLVSDVLLPGRLFPWGDYFNPWTNTVHLYSDHPAITLHEAGHAHDLAGRSLKGTYAFVRLLPIVDLYQEYEATGEALDYLEESKKRKEELRAYKILYPAFGTYVGRYVFAPAGTVVAAVIGHVLGRQKASSKRRYYKQLDAITSSAEEAAPAP